MVKVQVLLPIFKISILLNCCIGFFLYEHKMTQEFASTKAETAGVVAVFHAVPLLTGPLATWLTDRLNIY